MRDWMGRSLHYLRLSLTERCNLNCIYCRDGNKICPPKTELTLAQLSRIMQAFELLGIRKVRLTGGEPLMRDDLEDILGMVSSFEQICDVSMTTNAQGLAERLDGLLKAGLCRINISLDSLDADCYSRMTCGGSLQQALKGVDAALRRGVGVKINVVLVRGVNSGEIDDFIALARAYPIDVRFIELMPFSALGAHDGHRVCGSEILQAHPELYRMEPRYASQPSCDYRAKGFRGRVGLIDPISHRFCKDCNRVRLTSDGKLRMCLGNDEETDLRPWLDKPVKALLEVMQNAMFYKPERHSFGAQYQAVRQMNQIGG